MKSITVAVGNDGNEVYAGIDDAGTPYRGYYKQVAGKKYLIKSTSRTGRDEQLRQQVYDRYFCWEQIPTVIVAELEKFEIFASPGLTPKEFCKQHGSTYIDHEEVDRFPA